MVAGEVRQLSLISLEDSCVAKTQLLPSSWLRLWEPARKAKMCFTPLQAHAVSLSLSLSFCYCFLFLLSSTTAHSSLSLFLFHTHKNTARSHQKDLTFTPWLNYNLWFCSRPSSSIYSVMWFRVPTLQRTACGVGCMFRFLQINFVCLHLYFDKLNQSNVNKHS